MLLLLTFWVQFKLWYVCPFGLVYLGWSKTNQEDQDHLEIGASIPFQVLSGGVLHWDEKKKKTKLFISYIIHLQHREMGRTCQLCTEKFSWMAKLLQLRCGPH